jgi:hypothetical protein
MTTITPEQVLEQLCSNASTRTIDSLKAIYQICKEQQDRGLTDFSFSTVARLGKGKGVPAAQSIRNKTGEHFKTLIAAFSSKTNSTNKTTQKNSSTKSLAWIDAITDPVLKLQVNILYAEKKEAERLLQAVVPIDQYIEIRDNVGAASISARLTDLEREAMEYLVSDEFMRTERLERGPRGSIVRIDTQKTFSPVATLDAINKVLLHL